MKMIYLDNNTTTRPSDEAVSAMQSFFSDRWGVMTQPHKMGQDLFSSYVLALKSVYQLLDAADSSAVVMTSSGAEAINQAILSTYQAISLNEGKNHFITLATEEAPILMSLNRLNALGAATTVLKPDKEGLISPQQLIEAITPRTAMVALSWANGLTGVVQPIYEIAKICQLRGIRLLVDGTYVLGKLFFSLKEFPIDFFSFNGDHLHAPKGTGGLYIKQGIKLSPLITGGIDQGGLRAGALNMPAVVGLGIAAKQSLEARDYLCTEVARLTMLLGKEILKRIPRAKILFDDADKVPGVLVVSFPGVINEALLFALNQNNVFASIGGGSHPLLSYYLKTCGFDAEIADASLSLTLSRETTEDEVEAAASILERTVLGLYKVVP